MSLLLHVLGPWYCLQDIFLRYYYRDKLKRCEQSNNELNKSSKGATWAFMKSSLRECMTDLIDLYSMGMLRTFSSEEEAATTVGDPRSGNLLTERNRLEILSKLGGNPKKTRKADIGNEILTQLQSQPCISFGRMKHKQRVQHFFQGISIKNISQKISSLIHEEKSSSEIIESIENMWDEIIGSREGLVPSSLPLLQCFKLNERPLLTLRRAIRLYICGGEGPVSMRSDGSNAWISVHTGNSKLATISKKNAPSKPIIMEKFSSLPAKTCQWHTLSYPGLDYRLGLKGCEFTDNFIFTNTLEKDDRHQSQIFSKRSEFHLWEVAAELRNSFDYLIELNDQILSIDRKMRNNNEMNQETYFDLQSDLLNETNIELGSHVDPLSSHGRRELLHELLSGIAKDAAKNEVFNDIEAEISSLYPNPNFCESNLGLTPEEDNFYTNAERMICAIAIVCQKTLLFRFRTIGKHEMQRLIKRPWLRHLSWECVLAHLIWDSVEHMEKRGYHLLAVRMLETILHGAVHLTTDFTIDTQDQESRNSRDAFLCNYLQMLLSRRTRGKAFERLIIDKKHVINRSSHGGDKEKAMFEFRKFVKNAINFVSPTSSIPLSHTRKLAKQLKTPSSRVISDNMEILELGIRLRNDRDGKKDEHSDWSPLIDTSVANSISHASGTKKRCAYIGSEDSNGLCHTRSLNVEELAIESYASGTIPVSDPHCNPLCTAIKGGWRGWHSEGFHVRSLFRILCFDPILRHTFDNEESPRIEQQSIFLHRYQNAPLDLQVANSAFSGGRSFYSRRRKQIESFLVKLTSLCPQRIADLVYESIMKRKDRLNSHGKLWTKDQIICRDIRQIKTLSMLAAGFGGKLLSLMFRCLCYDHRHYMAGLPDLLLVRGICDMELVDLGEWIGEGFKETNATSIDIDKDEEFLSNTDNTFSSKKGKNNVQIDQTFTESFVPKKLHLSHDGTDVSIQCMFVEVKSANDSLDERQRDWLNIIDIAGNARVCKFISKKARDKK